MKRTLILAALSALCAAALAAPTLTSEPYPADSVQPIAASFTVNGGVANPCQLSTGTNGSVQPVCDLTLITAPGTYALTLKVSNKALVVNADGSGSYTTGGEASANFSYTLKKGLASAPVKVMLAQ